MASPARDRAKAERIDRLLRKQIDTVTLPALIACDVDGTLLGEDEKVTARTRNAVRAAVAAGAQFVLATGRPPRWIPPVVDGLGFAPMAVCANGAVIYDPATDRVLSARTLSVATLAELAEIATRVIPGAGLAVERVGASAHDSATPQFVSSPGYEHAWLNPDNTEVSMDDLLSAPAVKLLVRKAGARSADMAAELAKHVGVEGDITYSTNNGLVEIVPLGIDKATGIAEIAAAAWHYRRRHGSRSATCPTTCRCCCGPASAWRWVTRTPMRSRPPMRSPHPTPTTGWRGCWNAGGCRRLLGSRRHG